MGLMNYSDFQELLALKKKRKPIFIFMLIILVILFTVSSVYSFKLFNRTSNSPTLKTTDRHARWT